jgi:uncharacterized protein YcfJ
MGANDVRKIGSTTLAAVLFAAAACSSGDGQAAERDYSNPSYTVETGGPTVPLDTALDAIDTLRRRPTATAQRTRAASGVVTAARAERTASVVPVPSERGTIVAAAAEAMPDESVAPAPASTPPLRRRTRMERTSSTSDGSVTNEVGETVSAAPPAPVARRAPATRTVKHTQRDAAIGAAAGAIIGATTSRDRVKGGIIGGAAGAILGGVLGNNVDKQTQRIPDSLFLKPGEKRQTAAPPLTPNE